jgi:uncharacterized protein YdgA (DUF945 family)
MVGKDIFIKELNTGGIKMKTIKSLLVIILLSFSASGQVLDTLFVNPNPFYDTLNIHYELNSTDTISLKVLEINGFVKVVLFEDSLTSSGSHDLKVNFDSLNSWIYFLVLSNDSESVVQKIAKSEFPLSVKTLNLNDKDILYPNPTSGIMFTSSLNIGEIEIYDLKGVKVKNITSLDSVIDCSGLPSGMYIFRIKMEGGEYRYQIIKKTTL